MLDIVSGWTRKWRIRVRLGMDKTAFMCTGGNDLERNGQVYISTLEGERLKLQAVSCYVYPGFLIQCNLRCVQLLRTLRRLGNQRTWTVIQLAAKHNLRIPQTLIMWKSLVFNATKHLLIFCLVEAKIVANLSDMQGTWAKAILGWEHKLSGHAATSDLGWQHITRELMLARCSLYARIMKLPDTPVHVRMKDMLNAAAHINIGWTYHTITMFRVAISPVPPPTGHMTWQSMLPMATRNLRRLDEALRQAELSRNLTLPLYPKQGPTTKHQHALYELEMAFNQGLPSVWTLNSQHRTYTEKLQKHETIIEHMVAAGGTASRQRTYDFK